MEATEISWSRIKLNQADQADYMAAIASGIGKYEISNACYRLAGILRRQGRQAIRIDDLDNPA